MYNLKHQCVPVHGSVCSFCVCLCGWTRSLCLSALPSTMHLTRVISTVTGVARLRCLYLAGVSVVGCQIVIAHVVSYSLSVFQVLRLFSPSRCSVFLEGADWTEFSARAGDSALPGLLHLHCRVICTSTVFWRLHLHCQLICTSTVFWSCQIKTVYFTRASVP